MFWDLRRKAGFTLIELSMVLVIIALIVGGVLAGRELIEAAELRKVISKTEQYVLALNTFKNKYNCVAGDCANATAMLGASSNGNGNGKIDGLNCESYPTEGSQYCTGAVWNSSSWHNDMGEDATMVEEITSVNEHLARANLIPMNPYNRTDGVDMSTNGFYHFDDRNVWLTAFNHWGTNYIYLGGDDRGLASGMYYILADRFGFLPSELYYIDTKIDDGLPDTGKMRHTGYPVGPPHGFTITPQCRLNSDVNANAYNVTNAGIEGCCVSPKPCTLRYAAPF